MQDQKEEITLAEPTRPLIVKLLNTPAQLALIEQMGELRQRAERVQTELQERFQAEANELSQQLSNENQELFRQLVEAAEIEVPYDELGPLTVDADYLESAGVAFLKENKECPTCGGSRGDHEHGGGLAAFLAGLSGGGEFRPY